MLLTHTKRGQRKCRVLPAARQRSAFYVRMNCTTAQEQAEQIIYATNALNQYTQIDTTGHNFEPEYDADGNQTKVKTSTGVWHVTYNAQDRAEKFESADGTIIITCDYDYMGRRIWRKVEQNGETTLYERYLYRSYLQIAALDLLTEGQLLKHTILWDPTQPTATRPLALQQNSVWYTYGWDLTKNICEIYGQSGYIRTLYTYTPYGSVTAEGDVTQPIQWSSEMYDAEIDLVYYNYRYYTPTDGRWTRRDPAKGDYNLFVYVQNSPIKSSDYLGLMSKGTCNNLVSNILNNPGRYSAHIRQLIDKLKKKGCGVPYIYCTECCGETDEAGRVESGEFNPSTNSIKLCSNNSINATDILETIAHELIHALQYCEFDHENDDWANCDVIICQEMQAYRESGECQRMYPGNEEDCVKEGAKSSSRDACKEQGVYEDELEDKVASMYKSCYCSYGNPF